MAMFEACVVTERLRPSRAEISEMGLALARRCVVDGRPFVGVVKTSHEQAMWTLTVECGEADPSRAVPMGRRHAEERHQAEERMLPAIVDTIIAFLPFSNPRA